MAKFIQLAFVILSVIVQGAFAGVGKYLINPIVTTFLTYKFVVIF